MTELPPKSTDVDGVYTNLTTPELPDKSGCVYVTRQTNGPKRETEKCEEDEAELKSEDSTKNSEGDTESTDSENTKSNNRRSDEE